MYARYGLAMYFAQVVEAGVKNGLAMAELSSAAFATIDDFDESFSRNFKTVLGKLIQRLEPFLGQNHQLGEDLRLALAMRNQLAHHFFWDHAVDVTSREGRERMIAECDAAVGLFQEVEASLGTVVRAYSESIGTSPELLAARLTESTQDLLAQNQDTGGRNCGRCLVPMNIAGSNERPYFECPSCGSIALA